MPLLPKMTHTGCPERGLGLKIPGIHEEVDRWNQPGLDPANPTNRVSLEPMGQGKKYGMRFFTGTPPQLCALRFQSADGKWEVGKGINARGT